MSEDKGIEGILVEAGTLEEDFHGLLIRVPTDVLRDAKRMPLYRKVRVVEVIEEKEAK